MEYILNRGFTPETLMAWQLGFDPHSERITMPVRDERNNLIGFKGRSYNGKNPKYLVLGDRAGTPPHYGWNTYQTGKVVFGLPNAILSEDPHGEDSPRHFIVCEGELNAIAISQAGYAGIAISGSNLTGYQIETIRREADRLTFYFDDDAAGHRVLRASIEAFADHMPCNVVITTKDAAASTPTIRTRGDTALTTAPSPLASPPPPSGTITTSNDGSISNSSSAGVPAPAMTSRWLYGEMKRPPSRSANRRAADSAASAGLGRVHGLHLAVVWRQAPQGGDSGQIVERARSRIEALQEAGLR